ncbi:N-glycosylase/DNA lyase-like isoform X3 [Pomacea canaliculata]|nr:N-glycosylase/DNA lyase-like isoform X3 [Pomacea canaliculata]
MSGTWIGVMAGKVWYLKQDDFNVFYQVFEPSVNKSKESEKKCSQDFSQDKKPFVGIECYTQEESLKESCCRHIKLEHAQKESKAASHLQTDHLAARVPDNMMQEDYVGILREYFQLEVDIENLYEKWSAEDAYFKSVAGNFGGIRLLRQDPVENLFSFICASNNNIARISSMVEKLCDHFGRPITEVNGRLYHDFPCVDVLAQDGVQKKLRELGFGYRAEFIVSSAKSVMEKGGLSWLLSLRCGSFEKARSELMKLRGVGEKVADCVCLMSLDKTCAVPVDTHVWKFAAKHYLPALKMAKTLTTKRYQEISKHFQNIWGNYAGWAQCVLYAAQLKHMKSIASSRNGDTSEPMIKKLKH